MDIIGIKFEGGYYVTDVKTTSNYGYNGRLKDYFVNGVKLEQSFHKEWFISKEAPSKVERTVPGGYENERYELIDSRLEDRFRKVFKRSEVFLGYDDDDCVIYSEEFKNIHSLYEYKSDKKADTLEQVEFTFNIIQELEKIDSPIPFSYKRYGDYNKLTSSLSNSSVKRDMIDEIVTPSLLLHTKPVKLSHQQTFDIIRAYIKDNINPRVVEITSDYNFCLTVKKKVKKSNPVEYQVDVNNNIFSKRKRKPKYETRFTNHSSFTIFECAPKDYQNYTVVIPFEAESEADLKAYIDTYLEELINVINTPLEECECCSGRGVVIKD